MEIHFGTDGWRAIIADQFTFSAVRRVAHAFAAALQEDRPSQPPRVVVGFDRRFASDAFARAAAEALAACGVEALLCRQVAPTPVVSWTVVDERAQGGLVITASHNPPLFNGVKLKAPSGGPVAPGFTRRLEQWLSTDAQAPTGPGRRVSTIDPIDGYLGRLGRLVAVDRLRKAGLTVACDAMYGAMAGLLPRVLSGDATETVEINTAHNPLFPGLTGPEPVERNLTRLKRVVADGDATIGIAFDGDGDRIGVVDERGRYVSAQQVFALLARYVLDVRRDRRPIVKSVTGTAMVERLAEKASVAVVETPTGFPHISQAMVEEGAALGGEESGGFAFGFHLPERDGLLSALLLLDYVLHAGRPISELVAQIEADIGPWCYERVDLELEPETRAAAVARLHGARWPTSIAGLNVRRILTVDGTKIEFEDGSWLLARPSGTEPLLRLYAEAHDPETVGALLAAARDILKV